VNWSESVSSDIIHALDGCNWRAFYPIRIGYRDYNIDTLPEFFPVVLIVAVEEADMEWERATEIALACREVLRAADILDVEVEFQQATITKLAESRKLLERQVDKKYWLSKGSWQDPEMFAVPINTAMLPVCSSLGYHVQTPKGAGGTMGLHLQLEGEDSKAKTYGLVSRHVAIGAKMSGEMGYKKQDGDQDCFGIALPLSALEKCLESLEGAQATIEYMRGPLQRKMKEFRASKAEEDETNIYTSLLQYASGLMTSLTEVVNVKDEAKGLLERTLGHVAFSPPLDIHPKNRFLRDWALVELLTSQFDKPPENKVYIGADGVRAGTVCHKSLPKEETVISRSLDTQGFLRIQGALRERDQRQAFRVYKSGMSTGLTHGVVGEIEAILRTPNKKGEQKISWSLLVVSYPHETEQNKSFSRPGDSGSCVFDHSGRVVGILDAGQISANLPRFSRRHKGVGSTLPAKDSPTSPAPDGFIDFDDSYDRKRREEEARKTDVSFVTPIHWVLDDIEEFTGLKVRLL
jgi:hypothetical protein